MPQRNPNQAGEPPRPREDRLYVGQLLEHARANYEFHPKGSPSYFVKLKTDHGVQTLWGKGLERAFAESKTKPKLGEIIGIRENNLDPISVVARKQVDGVVVATRQYDTPRPHWVVERLDEFDRRAFGARTLKDPTISRRDAVINQPELLPFFWVLDAMKKTGDSRIKDPERREVFMRLARQGLSLAYERFEAAPLPPGAAQQARRAMDQLAEKRATAAEAPARTPE
ncbi:MAG: hypothetical protein ACJ8R9_31195 [Steroidobacteraceae bacterium]